MVTYKLYGEDPGETHRLLDTRESGVSRCGGGCAGSLHLQNSCKNETLLMKKILLFSLF